jgi:hypothetical protein
MLDIQARKMAASSSVSRQSAAAMRGNLAQSSRSGSCAMKPTRQGVMVAMLLSSVCRCRLCRSGRVALQVKGHDLTAALAEDLVSAGDALHQHEAARRAVALAHEVLIGLDRGGLNRKPANGLALGLVQPDRRLELADQWLRVLGVMLPHLMLPNRREHVRSQPSAPE